MEDPARFTVRLVDDAVVLQVTGTIDLVTARELRDEAVRATDRHPGAELIVDLAGVGFMDSTGLGALVAVQRATAGGRPLRVVAPSPIVAHAIEVSGLQRVLEVHRTGDELPQGLGAR